MKKFVLFFTLAIGGLIPLATAAGTASANTVNQDFPIQIAVFVPCANGGAGEDVYLTGRLHDLFSITSNNAGGFHFKYHDNPQGVTGTGVITGDKYQGTGVTQGETNLTVGNETTYVDNFRIIGPGPDNNFLVHENYHVTINANGELTAYVDNFSATCK